MGKAGGIGAKENKMNDISIPYTPTVPFRSHGCLQLLLIPLSQNCLL